MAQKRRCAIWNVILGIWLMGAVVADLRTYKIPNRLCFFMAGNGLLAQGYAYGVEGLLAGGRGLLIGIAVLFWLFVFRMLGAGDVKLVGAVGTFVGSGIWDVLAYSCMMTGIAALVRLAYTTASCRKRFYFKQQRFRTDGGRMHMSVPVFLGVLLYWMGGVPVGI